MEGRKLKNIVIIILLLLNGFLLVPVGGRRAQSTHSRDAALDSAVEILRGSGIHLEDGVVPRTADLPERQAVRELALEQEQAAHLLGGEVTVQARGGDVYRYENEAGWLQFHSTGEFLGEFEPGAFAVGEEDVVRHAARLLSQLTFDGRVSQKLEFGGAEHSDWSITFVQTLDGALVLDRQVTLHYLNGSLVSLSGRRVPGQPVLTGERSAVSAATALMRLYNGLNELGDVYNRIQTIEPAYRLSVSLSDPVRLIPAWYVKTDTGEYSMELQSGQVSRMGGAIPVAMQAETARETVQPLQEQPVDEARK